MSNEKSALKLVSTITAAERLGLIGLVKDPNRTVRSMIKRGHLAGLRVGRHIQVREDSIDRFIEGR